MYLSYNFIEKDPIIDEIRTIIQREKVTYRYIEHKSGVTYNTLNNWFNGKTKRPQAATIRAVLRCIGYDLRLVRSR